MGDFDMGLMTFQEQLEEYPALKEFVTKNARNPPKLINPGKTWRIYAQRRGGDRWRTKAFPTYVDAFKFMKPRLKTFHDISITSTRLSFTPPGRVVKIKKDGRPLMVEVRGKKVQVTRFVPIKPPPGHLWCMYCRRFTVFTYFFTHHALGKLEGESASSRRCCVCGIREAVGSWQRRR